MRRCRRNAIKTAEVLDEDLAGGIALYLNTATEEEHNLWQRMKDQKYEVLDSKLSYADIQPDDGEGQPFNHMREHTAQKVEEVRSN